MWHGHLAHVRGTPRFRSVLGSIPKKRSDLLFAGRVYVVEIGCHSHAENSLTYEGSTASVAMAPEIPFTTPSDTGPPQRGVIFFCEGEDHSAFA